jgi:hypothetical protein
LKKNESRYNKQFFIDFDKNDILYISMYLSNKFNKKLKNIKYINKGVDSSKYNYVEYKEYIFRIYLFDDKDLEDIKKYQINPYSGRVINENFFNKHFPDVFYDGNNIQNYCSDYISDIKIILNWIKKKLFSYTDIMDDLTNWVNNFKLSYSNIIYHRYDPKILKELLKYKKCENYKIYRGVSFKKKKF